MTNPGHFLGGPGNALLRYSALMPEDYRRYSAATGIAQPMPGDMMAFAGVGANGTGAGMRGSYMGRVMDDRGSRIPNRTDLSAILERLRGRFSGSSLQPSMNALSPLQQPQNATQAILGPNWQHMNALEPSSNLKRIQKILRKPRRRPGN